MSWDTLDEQPLVAWRAARPYEPGPKPTTRRTETCATQAIRVRAAEPADHPVIRDILRTAYGQYTHDIPPAVWRPYLADLLDLDRHARHGQLLVAVVDEAIAGYAAFYPDASVQGFGWPAGLGRRTRAGGGSRLPGPRRRRGAADRAGRPGARGGRGRRSPSTPRRS